MVTRLVIAASLIALAPLSAAAQHAGPVSHVTVAGGYAGFIDDATIGHGVVGVGAGWVVAPRLAIGPELLYMIGPDNDRDLFVLGVARIGLRRFREPVVPFLTVGGGLMRHSDRFNGVSFSGTEGAFIAGGGVRLDLSPRVYIAPEFAIGWEPHWRASLSVGVALP
jgi:opacity protein-like surface antigen